MEIKLNKIYGIRRYMDLEESLLVEYGDVVYVGKTKNSLIARLDSHTKDKSYFEKTEWLMKNEHEIILLEDDLCDYVVGDREQYWIEYFGTQYKLNRIRAKKINCNDGVSAIKRAKQIIKDMKKGN